MREIKFRGYDNENKQWRYGHFFETIEGIRKCYNIVENKDTKYYCEPNSISQYTGIKDKNGKEIYEGDIVETQFGVGEIVYHVCTFTIIDRNSSLKSINFLYNCTDCGMGDATKCKIIGNIYETPNLLSK